MPSSAGHGRSAAWFVIPILALAGCASAHREPLAGVAPAPPQVAQAQYASHGVRSPLIGSAAAKVANHDAPPSEAVARSAVESPPADADPAASGVVLAEHREPEFAPPADEPLPFPDLLAEVDGAEPAGDQLAPKPISGDEEAQPTPGDEPAETTTLAETAVAPHHPIDLGTALALAAGQNPEVAFARWKTQEAYARLDQAQVLWLPSIRFGVNYHRHDGNLQNIEGRIVDINRSSLNAGLGAGAVGAGTTTVPGLSAQFHVADAVFQPQIAERTAWASAHAADAVLQDRLLDAALAYLELLEAAQAISIAQDDLANAEQLAQLTSEFARTGQGLPADADRMQTEVALRRNSVIRADERLAVASSRLAEALSLDGRSLLLPTETTVAPIELVSLTCGRQQLLATGLTRRPELKESRCLVAEACERLRREKFAPLMPSVLLGMSYSGFGGGTGGTVSRFNDRADFDALAYWEVRNLGYGEQAARETAASRLEQTRAQQVRVMDRVAREIAESLAQVQHRRRQIDVAAEAITTAESSYTLNMSRIREGQGLPIEALQSIQALAIARREYLTSVVDYNEAQFRLQRALGWPVGR